MKVPAPRVTEGDLVQVTAPHTEAGARGTVEKRYRANADYGPRARVRFHPPYGEGSEIIALSMLEVIR